MKSELDALALNQTLSIIDLPPGKTPIGCKWVYRVKYHVDGSVERTKLVWFPVATPNGRRRLLWQAHFL